MPRQSASYPAGLVRDRILRHALSEFARFGFSGARVERIAGLARVSKRMLFYYFRDKQELFGAVLDSAWQDGQVIKEAPESALASARFWREFYFRNENFLRLMQWESIEPGPKGMTRAKARKRIWEDSVRKMRRGSNKPGGWPKTMDPRYVVILGLGLIAAPLLLPTVTKLTTGLDPHDPRFVRKHGQLVDEIIARVIAGPRRARRSSRPVESGDPVPSLISSKNA
jgi:TetR/AcrR family transcriptional regulator